MNSEDTKLKNKESINVKINQIDNKDKITESPDEDKTSVIKPRRETMPLINIRKVSSLSDSVINYFIISISLFIYSSYNLGWFNLKDQEKFVNFYYLFAGVILYVIGILNWYEGKELLLLFDFIFSFLFMILYLKDTDFIKIGIAENNKLEGLFYIIFFAFILIIAISAKEKGIIFIINYIVLFIAFVFLFVDTYFKTKKWIKYVYCYAFIVSAGFLWITGILILLKNGWANISFRILDPTD